MRSSAILRALRRNLQDQPKAFVKPGSILAAHAFRTPMEPRAPSPSRSPPHKRAKPSAPSPPSTVPDAGPSSSKTSTEVMEAPLRAMFAPARTKAEVKKRKKMKHPVPEPYSSDDVLWHDVRDFLGAVYVDKVIAKGDEEEWEPPAALNDQKEHTLRVGEFTVAGESLSLFEDAESGDKKWAIVVPFAHPGDLIRVKVQKHNRFYSTADLLEILEYSETYRGGEGDRRKNPEAGCKYFGVCGGCQFQPMPYEQQLLHKKRTLELAYARYSRLPADVLPPIQDTIPSPKQWNYRTKITPHFDAMPKWLKRGIEAKDPTFVQGEDGVWRGMVDVEDRTKTKGGKGGKRYKPGFGLAKPVPTEEDAMNGQEGKPVEEAEAPAKKEKRWKLDIGFEGKGGVGVLDIEECPIATPILNQQMGAERKKVQDTIFTFPRGATLLLRDSLPAPEPSSISPFDPSTPILPEDQHLTITNHKLPVYERVGEHLFTFTAGSFFQNNNSILVPLTSYVRDAIFPPGIPDAKKPTHLVDTYCGSGLFGITLSSGFQKVAGVEIDPQAVEAAKKNAEINNLGGKSTWLCGKAEDIFGDLPQAGFAGSHSCVVVDPPRKGCDEAFLEQLLRFKPLTVVYVSCNVHTQARDLGWFLQVGKMRGINYTLESLRGFDLFPQTAHVEGVAVLRLAE